MPKESASLRIWVDGVAIEVAAGLSVGAALWNAGLARWRTSVSGEPRGPLCSMGTCFECRVTIDGVRDRRACLEPCRDGMQVSTGG
jgi:predicted molibdopterin-dependent oxidoreductase YjgC